MKTVKEIDSELFSKIAERAVKEKAHSILHQIDMLSGSGEKLRREINECTGWIEALKWMKQ